QAEDGIRDRNVTGVQTCALPIYLLGRLAVAGAQLLVATFDGLEAGTVVALPQPLEGISHAPKLEVEDARVDWSRPAFAVDRLVRSEERRVGTEWTDGWSASEHER